MIDKEYEGYDTPFGKLTEKQGVFADKYIETRNATASYREAYPGATEKAAESSSCRLLRNDKVCSYISQRLLKSSEKLRIDADYVLQRAAEIDRLDVLDIINDNLTIKPLSEWPKAWRISISALEVMELGKAGGDQEEMLTVIKKIKWPDKAANLDRIGRHIDVAAFKEQTNGAGTIVNVELSADQYKAARIEVINADDC